jgi:hypothetical protein
MGWLTSTPVGYPFVMTRPTSHAIAGTISRTIGSSAASKSNVAVSCPSNSRLKRFANFEIDELVTGWPAPDASDYTLPSQNSSNRVFIRETSK